MGIELQKDRPKEIEKGHLMQRAKEEKVDPEFIWQGRGGTKKTEQKMRKKESTTVSFTFLMEQLLSAWLEPPVY